MLWARTADQEWLQQSPGSSTSWPEWEASGTALGRPLRTGSGHWASVGYLAAFPRWLGVTARVIDDGLVGRRRVESGEGGKVGRGNDESSDPYSGIE